MFGLFIFSARGIAYDNTAEKVVDDVAVAGVQHEALKSFVDRIERLEQDKAEISEDIRNVYAEAKFSGFDLAVLKQVIKDRRLDNEELERKDTLLYVYKRALGMVE